MTKSEFDRQLTDLILGSGLGLSGMDGFADIFSSVASAIGNVATKVGSGIGSAVNLIGDNAGKIITPLASTAGVLITANAQKQLAQTQMNQQTQLAQIAMTQQLAQQGYNFVSPQAQQFLSNVASTGVVDSSGRYIVRPATQSALSTYLPFILGGVGLMAVLVLAKKK